MEAIAGAIFFLGACVAFAGFQITSMLEMIGKTIFVFSQTIETKLETHIQVTESGLDSIQHHIRS